MSNRKSLLAFTALASLSGGIVQAVELPAAPVNRAAIEAAFKDYEFIDIRFGLSQVKVEAVDNDSGKKIEAIYDKATGQLLKSEEEDAGDDAGRSGVSVRSLTDNFIGDDDDDDDDQTGADDDSDDDSAGDDDSDDSTGGDDDGDDSSGGDDDGDDDDDDSSGGDDDDDA